MPLPYYVSPEQVMQDKAEYAKKGIAKGRSIIALEYQAGIVLVALVPFWALVWANRQWAVATGDVFPWGAAFGLAILETLLMLGAAGLVGWWHHEAKNRARWLND